jgi:hypothetical protein
MNTKTVTVAIPAERYEHVDDCLGAAAADAKALLGLDAWNLRPRWADEQRECILLDVPAWSRQESRHD